MLPGESRTQTSWPVTIDGGKMRGHTAHKPVFPLTASCHAQVFDLHQRLVQPEGGFLFFFLLLMVYEEEELSVGFGSR